METRGQEIQRWANPINEFVLRQVVQEQEEIFISANETDTVLELLLSVNAILETILVSGGDDDYSDVHITVTVPEWAAGWNKFHELAKEWKGRKKISSRAQNIVYDPHYLQIIGMGAPAVPLILSQLRRELEYSEPDHWFTALWAITGENPVPLASRGNLAKMAEAWLDWGAAKGFVSAKGMGAVFPKSR
jgi:hypothetical protein